MEVDSGGPGGTEGLYFGGGRLSPCHSHSMFGGMNAYRGVKWTMGGGRLSPRTRRRRWDSQGRDEETKGRVVQVFFTLGETEERKIYTNVIEGPKGRSRPQELKPTSRLGRTRGEVSDYSNQTPRRTRARNSVLGGTE